ncbi:hypothetical protein ACFOWA_19975 [Pedobacter lithocola]|uniref:Uncharacterized protein n=1 Tax=Pedobacter lithocola TaxID=1908239 RepID=A0ABV8PHL6_9SPHI
MLSINPDFTIKDIDDDINALINQEIDGIIDSLKESGKFYVDRARAQTKSDGGFSNLTYNLRESIGYVLVADHQIIDVYFPPISNASGGAAKGEAYAREIATLVDDGELILIVVAGLEYAAFVEATEHDVISGSSMAFEKLLKSLLL